MRKAPGLISVVLLIGCAQPPAADPRIDGLADRFAVQDAANELFLATDLKDWDRVRAIFADRVLFT
jgi:hypothetical protein